MLLSEKIESILLPWAKARGWIIARQSTVNADAESVHMKARIEGLRAGKEIGILEVLRYNQQTLSPAKFKESAERFGFEELDRKYPLNPLLERQDERQVKTPARS